MPDESIKPTKDELYADLPIFTVESEWKDEGQIRSLVQSVVRRLNGDSGLEIPLEQMYDFIRALPPNLPIYRGTDLFPDSTTAEDFTIYPSKALVYADGDYSAPHPYPIIDVSTVGALLDYLDQEMARQVAKGYVPEPCNIVTIQDIARSGSLKVLIRSISPNEFEVKKYRVKRSTYDI